MIHGPKYVAFLLKYAILLSGYSLPHSVPLPKLVELTHAQMIHKGCDDHRPCGVYGTYHDDGIIYVDPFLIHHDGITEDGVVVHELTHWLQQYHGHAGFTCKQIGFREREAYHVQKLYVEKYEHRKFSLHAPAWTC